MPITRRLWLKGAGAIGAGSFLAPVPRAAELVGAAASAPLAPPPDGTIAALTSTSGVFIPPRGRRFMKFSFDFPEPSVAFGGVQVGARVFTLEDA